ncbi:uncharacterized protein IL334_000907 [Kwoniella shivajii]|uniref:BZIP domain-containing protein n=1 Tax=Kwoniella shivajii TaxID=564305 RepID=A0ABZ1CS20_9TREE|nr:hypothetical protein IL334_000907 [Kwoniella shivajii]
MSEAGGSSVPPSDNNGNSTPKDRHEPRGRKPNDQLPPSRAREVQRAFRLRRAEHLAALEERILHLEQENNSLRALLNLPITDKGRIGSGPTGRGKSLKEGGVPMSERVRARKEARARERIALGLPMVESSENELDMEMDERDLRNTDTLSPRLGATSSNTPLNHQLSSNNNNNNNNAQQQQQQQQQPPLFTNPPGNVSPAAFNYNLPMPFNLPVSPDTQFSDFTNSDLYKNTVGNVNVSGSTPNFGGMFSMFDTPPPSTSNDQNHNNDHSSSSNNNNNNNNHHNNHKPISSSSSNQHHHQQHHQQHQQQQQQQQHQQQQQQQPQGGQPVQLDLLTRLKSCCHVSDSHVVNDPGLLVFATRLCQQFGCSFNGSHLDPNPHSDNEHLTLEDSWRSLKMTLDPVGDPDGENRINTGKMASELVIRAAQSRGGNNPNSGWIMCRYREGLSIKKSMVQALVQGLGGKLD